MQKCRECGKLFDNPKYFYCELCRKKEVWINVKSGKEEKIKNNNE